ncbi:MAG: hypothetical protein QM479_09940 [Pseudomonadota bacterium]
MKKILLATILLLLSQFAIADYYDITVTLTDDDTYFVEDWSSDHEYWEIKTENCYEYAHYDEVTLSYSWYGYDHYLIFPNGYSCDVEEALDIKVYD